MRSKRVHACLRRALSAFTRVSDGALSAFTRVCNALCLATGRVP